MEAVNNGYLRDVHLRKVGLAFLLCLFTAQAFSQFNYLDLNNRKRKIYFGISLGVNFSDFKTIPSERTIQNDSVFTFNSTRGPGFNLGIIGNWQFHEYLDLRLIPSLTFSDKNLNYNIVGNREIKKTTSSIYIDFPLMIRYKSKPIKDFRVFVLLGAKYSFDLASNQTARKAEDQVRVGRHDISLEYGIGFQIYFPFFILSPELKVSHGMRSIHVPTDNLVYSRVIDRLLSRAFTISFNLEG